MPGALRLLDKRSADAESIARVRYSTLAIDLLRQKGVTVTTGIEPLIFRFPTVDTAGLTTPIFTGVMATTSWHCAFAGTLPKVIEVVPDEE